MNENLDPSNSSDSHSETSSQVVADNYRRYLEDEYGYAYSARDIVSIATLESHDRLIDDPHGALADREWEDLDDFEQLGLARGLAEDEALEDFSRVLESLLDSEEDHEGVRYPELPLYGARVALRHGEGPRALEWLDRGVERWPERARPLHLMRARIEIRRDNTGRASEIYEDLAESNSNDPELAFEIAEDLVDEGRDKWAHEWIGRARAGAKRVGDEAIQVDLDVLEERIGPA